MWYVQAEWVIVLNITFTSNNHQECEICTEGLILQSMPILTDISIKRAVKLKKRKKHQTHLVMVIFVFLSYLVAADFQSNCLGKVSL